MNADHAALVALAVDLALFLALGATLVVLFVGAADRITTWRDRR